MKKAEWPTRERANASETLLERLTVRQHVTPHAPLGEAVRMAALRAGYCSKAVDHALRRLELPADRLIGRLRRSELMQLARCVDRFSRLRPVATPGESIDDHHVKIVREASPSVNSVAKL